MKVVLLKDIAKLGKEGDLCQVKDGYGRNYLIPKQLALLATKTNLNRISQFKKDRQKKQEKEMQGLSAIKDKIDNLSLTVTAEAKEDETLYGSITESQILSLLAKEGVDLVKDKLVFQGPIDKLGVYKIPVKIIEDLEATLRLWVVKK